MKRLIINILFSISVAFVTIFLLEFIAKVVNPHLNLPHANIGLMVGGRDVLEYPGGYIKDRELFWKMDSSCKEYNSFGFRDREFSSQKDKDVFRIICMGDSVTFGWPSNIEDTYPKLLEMLLNLRFPKHKFEVFNAGVPGYTSYQGLIWLKKDIINYNVNLLIVYYGINGRTGSYKSDKKQVLLPVWLVNAANYLRKFQFYQLSSKIILHFKYPPGKKYLCSINRVAPEEFRNNLLEINNVVEKKGGRVLFITKPLFYYPEKKIIFTDDSYFPPEGILNFDIYSIFKKRKEEIRDFFLDDVRPYNFHLTAKGHKVLAEEIFNFLIASNLLE